MLIGAHVSPAGGPAKAVERGVEKGCASIQIFNQNPRAWKPTIYADEAVAAYHEAIEASDVDALLIHAVYLLNCGSEDPEIADKSRTSLIASLRAGDALKSRGVVLHPGSALMKGGSPEKAMERAAVIFREALAESEACPLHLENTAGSGGTLGRSFEELANLIELAGGDERIGVTLDSCHLHASGYDMSTPEGVATVIDEFDRVVGIERLASLHVNDSKTPLGSNVDRHAPLGEGEIGRAGITAFLSEPRFEGLPCIFEGPGLDGKEAMPQDLAIAWRLRAEGLAARAAA
jgi:deoxyribonuclease-4